MLWKWVNSDTQVFILDLDGTLMPSAEVDNECFWQAVFGCFGERDTLPDLHGFKHVTDTGILDEWCIRELGRVPNEKEIMEIQERFVQLLEAASINQPRLFKPFPGVRDWLERVCVSKSVLAGIATGGWQKSARLKLKLSGLDRFDLPLASSDDARERTRIMQIAAQRTLRHQPGIQAAFTYIGDGAWDLRASEELGWEFIGIADGSKATQLRQAGAKHTRRDFRKTPG
jgi:phosphoglycolate phosphatase-like HAD superfamily hydrolase